MSNSKVIYRDLASNRLITEREADARDPETWVKEVFVQTLSPYAELGKEDLPSVQHLAPARATG